MSHFSNVVMEQKAPPAVPSRPSVEARMRLTPNGTPIKPHQPMTEMQLPNTPPQHSYQPHAHAQPPSHAYAGAGPPQHSYAPPPSYQQSQGPPQHSYQQPPSHAYQQPPAHAYNAGPPQHSYQQPVEQARTAQFDPVKKSAGAGRSNKNVPVSPTRFGYWGGNMGMASAWAAIFLGACAIGWGVSGSGYKGKTITLITGIYGVVLGIGLYAYENYLGIDRQPVMYPIRFFAYAALSVFCFFSEPMIITGVFLACTAIVQLISTIMAEKYEAEKEQKKDKIVLEAQASFTESISAYITMLRQQNKLGVLIFLSAYIAANMVLFAYNVNFYTDFVNEQRRTNPSQYLSGWIPYAKGFGNLLDFNCALILVPVCRTFLRILYNRSTADQGFFARTLRGILYFIPIDKNIAFHKLIAKMALMAAIGHTVCHFFNYAAEPTLTMRVFGISPWITGGLILLCMQFIFTSAAPNVRRGQFEIFWYNHHLFVCFFILILAHGKDSRNPHFHWWFIGPGALYVLERMLRIYRAHKKVVILSVTMMDDVFSLEFSKEGVFATPFKEGQYIFLNSPAVSRVQWHPFTISSAPQERTVTVHIRVLGPGSWTRGLRDYIGNMGPSSKSFFTFERMEPGGKLQGKICGPDGKKMLSIDGPHSAPTQHIGEYSHVIVIGAGIGVTPVAATLKSVIFHRWKYFVGQCFPDHAYFVWVCAHRDIDAFRWLIRYIKDAQDEVTHMSITNPTNMATKTFEMHIFVTSVPKDQKPIEVVVDDEIGFWGVPREEMGANGIREVEKHRCNWDEADLYRIMMCPPPHTQLNNIHIWEGRPKWDPLFQHVGDRHAGVDIGVAFCGNPLIGRDLYRQCYTHSRGRKNGIFKYHKENF